MNTPSVLRLRLGVADLVVAIGMASLSLQFPDSGCAGLGRLMCWAASMPVLTALWLLVHPRSANWGAMLVGIAASVIAAMVVGERPSDVAEDPVTWTLLLAGIVQLPIGLWVRRAVRAVAMTKGA